MDSLNEILDNQSLTCQLANDTNDLITTASSVAGRREVNFSVNHLSSPNNTTLFVGNRTSSPPTSAHNGAVDKHNVVAHTVVTTSDGTITNVEGAGPVVMVRTIIDGLSHSPVHSTFQATAPASAPNHHLDQHPNNQYHVETSHEQLLQIGNDHQRQQDHHRQLPENRLHGRSPVEFVGSNVTLDELAVGSSPNSSDVNIIGVKQEHKDVILDTNEVCNNSSGKRRREETSNLLVRAHLHHGSNSGSLDVSHIDVNVSVDAIDDLSSDTVEVTLNQHHHHHVQQHHQQLLQHHYSGSNRKSGNSAAQDSQHHDHQQHLGQLGGLHNQHKNAQYSVQETPSHHHQTSHHEVLSVIVQQHEDSRGSAAQMLSPELGVVGDSSIEPTTYQTLTSVNGRMSPPSFSPTSSYATLTPLQPLPPISTMSDKFVYGGHINGGGVGVGGNGIGSSTSSNSNSSSGGVGPFAAMPHQNSLGGLSLSSLSSVQSPYSSYDKLPSIGMPMSPPHNYVTPPSHTLSGMVVACELQTGSPSPCGALSPQSAYSHSTELQSPPLPTSKTEHGGLTGSGGRTTLQMHQSESQKQVICLSPRVTMGNGTVVRENVVVTGYESPYDPNHRDILVNTTPTSSSTSGGRSSHLQLPHSPILSPHSVSAGSVSLNSPGSCSMVNQTVLTLPPINGAMATLSAASLGSRGIAEISPLHRDTVVVSLTPSPPSSDMVETAPTLSVIHQPTAHTHHQQQQQVVIGAQQQHQHHSKHSHPVTSDCSLNVSLSNSSNLRLTNIHERQNMLGHNNNLCNIVQQPRQQFQSDQQPHQLQINIQHITSSNNGSNSSSGSSGGNTIGGSVGSSSNSSGGANSASVLTGGNDMEEINTKDLAQRISAELKRYSIPQAIFAQRVLCRSQGTLSDLLRNPKPWSKLKSGRETFRRMYKWLQEPEFQRMSALRMAAAQMPQRSSINGTNGTVTISSGGGIVSPCSVSIGSNSNGGGSLSGNGVCRRKEEPHIEQMPQPKKPRLVFTDLQRRTLQAIFKETKRPSKEMQVTIARQLGLEPTTVGNFFMNARRRSMDKWRDDDSKGVGMQRHGSGSGGSGNRFSNNNSNDNDIHHHNYHHQHHHAQQHQQSAISPSNHNPLDLDDDPEVDLDLGHDDFDLEGEHDHDPDNDDML
ncbi:homeobox protein onecut isoform X1 [Anastrepha obliqua]|uniref:homeobox protein onecut isoform X1 n=1 Tax=Anastrepha obliqua TaxID=95512 RepID=UPI0024096434|nr:homeobox protein onecut isoform X1 [Anastrepha obliqua]